MNAEPNPSETLPDADALESGAGTAEAGRLPSGRGVAPDTEQDQGSEEVRNTLARRVRLAVESTWEEAQKLSEAILDVLVVPPSGFAATAIAWITTSFFFVISLAVGAVLGLGALVLFIGLECLAALAYAYPASLFLLSIAGGIVPPLLLYWGIHVLFGVEGSWASWAFYPLILSGAWGSYYYWRFGRVIATTGDGLLAFYRGAAPKAGEIFGLPFLLLSGVWDVLKLVFGLFRGVTREFFKLFLGQRSAPHMASRRGSHSGPRPEAEHGTNGTNAADDGAEADSDSSPS